MPNNILHDEDHIQSRSIAVITCSTRPSRIGHLIAQHVMVQLDSHLSKLGRNNLHLSSIDMLSHPLPLLDEPGIPSKYPATNPTSHYTKAHTRDWSLEILKHSAFIFVIPQYNWGYPAVIKNAMDYLYHEWAGKPVFVVSYGGHGGGKAAAQLVQVCQGLRMKPLSQTVGYRIDLVESSKLLESGKFSSERLQIWKSEIVEDELQARFLELVESMQ
ncbi:hypothetical protein BGAL_0685g00010 [Botrytis galanthina]|uniref:NADPH-dependent FMN reductase-like domain-containing protein n=1 Tax=Botrytis galanthina TaxID=278940 RepID=A0A4S8QI75_9HELO|nr:hypothetical protein BGAL_0685g00010 [Botrytis galanthina]